MRIAVFRNIAAPTASDLGERANSKRDHHNARGAIRRDPLHASNSIQRRNDGEMLRFLAEILHYNKLPPSFSLIFDDFNRSR
jgi:hypothetical protein